MQDNFQVAQKLMQILVRRLREADRNIESLALLDVYGRVARLLLDLSEEEGGKRLVRQKISKQDMARMIGASREMVSKVMRDLEVGGYIISERRSNHDHRSLTLGVRTAERAAPGQLPEKIGKPAAGVALAGIGRGRAVPVDGAVGLPQGRSGLVARRRFRQAASTRPASSAPGSPT